MTRRGTSRDRRGNIDCVLTNSKVAGCSPKHSIQAIGGSVLKTTNVNPCRRQSLRLKEINAIYESEDARTLDFSSKHQHQTSGDSSPVANQFKVENPMPEQGHSADNGYIENCVGKKTIIDCDDLSINDMTLKDLQTRSKVKKHKSLKSVASTATKLAGDQHLGLFPKQNRAFPKQNRAFVKPKEEDPDLEEPLISLKIKLSDKSFTERMRRKRTHPLESFVPVEEITAQTCLLSSDAAQCSSPVATDRASTTKELAAEDELELTSIMESAYENLEVISKKDPLYAGSPELVCNVRKEIMETFLCDEQNRNNAAVCSTSSFIGDCYVLDNSSTELFQKASEGESNNGKSYCSSNKFLHLCVTHQTEMSSHNSSPSPVSELGTSLQVDSPELVNVVESEVLEIDSLESENTIYVAVSSTVDFIAKFSYPGNSSTKLLERVDGVESKCGALTSSTCEPLHCCVNEVYTEHMEVDNFTCLWGSCEDHFGEIRELNSSEMSYHKVSPSFSEPKISPLCADNLGLLSATMDLSADVCGSMENHSTSLKDIIHKNTTNQMNYLATPDGQQSMYINNGMESSMKEIENLVDEVPVAEMPTCSHIDNVAVDLPSRETHDLGDVSDSSTKGGCPDNSVLEALAGVSLRNSNEDHIISHIEESSSVGAYNICSPLHSNTRFSTACDSCAANESSPETKKLNSSTLEQMLNGYTEKVTHSAEVDAEKLVKALDCHSPQVSLPFLGAENGLHYVEYSLSKAADKFPSSATEERLYSTIDMPTNISSEISNSVDEQVHCIEKELKCDQGVVEHPPKKLLSNRKDFSPISQEKLRQVLNGNDLYDTTQISNYGEAEVMMSPERMIKRLKSSRNGFLPPVTKGILKPPDTSCRTPCSCTKSSLPRMQAQKAVTFSQRQMHDIESIATKLLKGLKSMKNIVEETLCSEACPSASSKFTPEGIRIATESSSDLEVTTKKWLSMMAKDCNRFCKIMRLAENKVAAPVNGFQKQRKKITFADETGGLLCHVKVFEQQPAFVVPRSQG